MCEVWKQRYPLGKPGEFKPKCANCMWAEADTETQTFTCTYSDTTWSISMVTNCCPRYGFCWIQPQKEKLEKLIKEAKKLSWI
jgi:hypothetical protein